jgi:PAS domain S-box-containing protein
LRVSATQDATGWASLFRTAFERSANPMALLRPNRVFVAVNQAFVDTFGYTPEQVVDRRADFLVEPRMLGQVETDWETLRRTGQITGNREFVAADGGHVRVHFAAQRADVIGEELVLYVVLPSRPRQVNVGSRRPGDQRTLTPREREVVSEIAMGRRVNEIAARLFISPTTVRSHVRNAMEKVGARSQAQLVAIALSECLLDHDCVHRDQAAGSVSRRARSTSATDQA